EPRDAIGVCDPRPGDPDAAIRGRGAELYDLLALQREERDGCEHPTRRAQQDERPAPGHHTPWRARNGRTAVRKPVGLSPITECPAPATTVTWLPGTVRTKRAAPSAVRMLLS